MKDKIPFYNIVNMFFVGAVFSLLVVLLFFGNIRQLDFNSPIFSFFKDWSVIVSAVILVILFEIGFILNRMSSIFIGPILSKTKIWGKGAYNIDVSEISESNPTFKAMCTELVLIRTHILMYTILGILSLFSEYKWAIFICIFIIIIMVLSGYKHNQRINIIKKEYAERKKKQKDEVNKVKKYLSGE